MKPFRFAVQVSQLPYDSWRERVRWYEHLGFSVISTPDHYALQQWDPVSLMATVAGATRSAGVSSTVLNVALRQPVDLARIGATIAAIAAGGCELGLGAGWMPDDAAIAGLPFESPGERLERLEETVQAIKLLWTQEKSDFDGKHVKFKNAPSVLKLPLPRKPKLLLGGTMRRALSLAGRHADIVSVFPSVASGHIGFPGWAANSTFAHTAEQTTWARQAAPNPDAIELSTQITFTAVADDPAPLQAAIAHDTGVDAQSQNDSTIFLTGTPTEARDKLKRCRDATGLSYFVIFDVANNYVRIGDAPSDAYYEALSEAVIKPLTGQ